MSSSHDKTRLLKELEAGDESAFDRLVPLIYDDLKRIARRYTRRQGSTITVDTTGLVHEAYVKLVDRTQVQWQGRDHFLAVYSVVMRNLMVDLARQRKSAKRGGELKRVTFDDNLVRIDEQAEQLLAVNGALQKLTELDERLARVVECRFFAGLTEDETAQAIGVTTRTVQRDWVKAKALLSEWLSTN
jgi:RNA polymerase sigma factor (TIGR02999 family)